MDALVWLEAMHYRTAEVTVATADLQRKLRQSSTGKTTVAMQRDLDKLKEAVSGAMNCINKIEENL